MESPTPFKEQAYKAPSARQQSWGAVISILIIVAMIVIGAYYAWDKRVSEQKAYTESHTSTAQ